LISKAKRKEDIMKIYNGNCVIDDLCYKLDAQTVDAIQKIANIVILHKHVQIALGKNVVVGDIYIHNIGSVKVT
jgi:hypothetical protein